MALQTIRIGSASNIMQYDDAAFATAVETLAPMTCGAPVLPEHVARQADITSAVSGASGTFTTADGKTVTVSNGLITSMV